MSKIYRVVHDYGTWHFFKDAESGDISIRQGGLPEDATEVMLLSKNQVHGFVAALFTANATVIDATASDIELEKMRDKYEMLQQLYGSEDKIAKAIAEYTGCQCNKDSGG